eukprot:CAMPEP_0194286808 /NCGR_PEP_ID=MMETSP0169-20130528/33347_1 /TAXON_ID=218684 /ORGANISM="Corethron pennatum, Strain L29A3" /LENGTH=158 /DNA_ID=CAMNT_0039033323 /DNA_START=296 /DNA_END=770 /DNA_ORIENTATION=-
MERRHSVREFRVHVQQYDRICGTDGPVQDKGVVERARIVNSDQKAIRAAPFPLASGQQGAAAQASPFTSLFLWGGARSSSLAIVVTEEISVVPGFFCLGSPPRSFAAATTELRGDTQTLTPPSNNAASSATHGGWRTDPPVASMRRARRHVDDRRRRI